MHGHGHEAPHFARGRENITHWSWTTVQELIWAVPCLTRMTASMKSVGVSNSLSSHTITYLPRR